MNLQSKDWIKPAVEARKISQKTKNGNRSSKRTDALNKHFGNLVKEYLPEKKGYSYHYEEKIPCSRGDDFTVDVLVKKNGEVCAIFLLKAVEKSYNKNRHNYANTVEGEFGRIFDGDKTYNGVFVVSVDWVPWEVPAGSKFESTKVCNQSMAEKRFNKFLSDEECQHENCEAGIVKIRYSDVDSPKKKREIEGSQKLHEILTRVSDR